MARLLEFGIKTTKIWEAPERVLEIFRQQAGIARMNFKKHYSFANFYQNCLAVCPELVEKVKLISYEENKPDTVRGMEANILIIEEFANEEQTKQLIESYGEKIW